MAASSIIREIAIWPLLLAWCLLLSHRSVALADVPRVVEKNGAATLLVDAPTDKDGIVINLADVFTVTLEVDGSSTLTVKPPEKITNSPGWQLVAATAAATIDRENGRTWRQSYTFEPLRPGALSLQIEPLSVGEDLAALRKIGWKPLAVRILTNLSTADLKELRDPTVIEALPAPPEARTISWPAIGVGALLVSLVAASVLYRRRRARPSPHRAEQRALRELGRVLAWHLPDQGKIERFHTLLANVVRRYLENKFQLPARRRTTAEFLDVVRTCQGLSGPQQGFLRDFFTSCDLAKFAGANVSTRECLALAEKARAFIGQSSPTK